MSIIMESFDDSGSSHNDSLLLKKVEDSCIETTTNWEIENNKSLDECISTAPLSQAPERTDLEDVVSLETCVALKADPSKDSCRVEFKVKNTEKIARIAVVSEASVLEFFKQSGEYATTVFADFIDEFQDHAVYFAEAKIHPPSSEASIKFTRTKSKGSAMWIYGIKLILTEAALENSKGMFDLDVINTLLSNSNQSRPGRSDMAKKVFESFAAGDNSMVGDMGTCIQKLATMNWNSVRYQENNASDDVSQLNNTKQEAECNGDIAVKDSFDLKTYIDDKFASLEERLIERIELMDKKTNQKLDAILKKLDLNVDNE